MMQKPVRSAAWLCLLSLATAMTVASSSKMMDDSSNSDVRNPSASLVNAVHSINQNVNAQVFDMPRIFVLPMDLSPAPPPNPACYQDESYEDETITVKCWHERVPLEDRTVTANFADVKIVHPTQLRMAFAGGTYGTTKRTLASKMAAANNAVLAINADFYNCRTDGLIVRQGKLYRKMCVGIDTLLIDMEGDFHVMLDFEAQYSELMRKGNVYQAINFGPVIVEDGKPVKKLEAFRSIACGPRAKNPRTAIGQLGRLHYLVCTVDGRSDSSDGLTTNELGVIMADKGCRIAYNLDGGQSTTMIFHNQVYNVVSDGGERHMSDILYFGSGVPEEDWRDKTSSIEEAQ